MKFFYHKREIAFLCVILSFFAISNSWADTPIRIYIDADRTGVRESGISIEQGIRTALSEVNNKLNGREVELIILDHRGNSARSRLHLEKFLKDENALAVFAGLHSPPLLANREFIHQNGILTLVPWAAAGPITRYPSKENWIFRLSVDDTKAGYVIAAHAIIKRNFQKPHLLLEQTGWGTSNHKTMTRALKEQGMAEPDVIWFNWGLKEAEARIMLRNIAKSGSDVIFLVANAPEGKEIVKAMFSLPEEYRLAIMSHWGITGGDFPKAVGPAILKKLNLEFIQTKFSFLEMKNNPFAQNVFNQAKLLFLDVIRSPRDIKAPTGFIHAYDLTRLLISAVNQAGLTGDMKKDRAAIRHALEHLEKPVEGLIKTYLTPFLPYDETRPDAHEALGIADYTMARYGAEGEIILEK
ncbi:ABC transporter substrate-binding protein [Desulfobacterales bacterium HSG2]|nr:ABC transporter substrate-binding protein [Desulfobacterales bacterium HSG2]